MMKHSLSLLLILLALIASACGSSSLSARTPKPTPTPTRTLLTTSHYVARLSALNTTHVSGTADFKLTGNVLVITINATGLQPDKEHYLHIHGATGTPVTCPTLADADASGYITIEKALTIIGPVALDLQPYPQPDAHGAISWSQIFHYDRALTVACGPIEAV